MSDTAWVLGGGIVNQGSHGMSVVTLTDSTVSDNSAGELGGGIYSSFGRVTLTNSMVSGNTAELRGGGIYNYATVELTHSTVSDNIPNDCTGC